MGTDLMAICRSLWAAKDSHSPIARISIISAAAMAGQVIFLDSSFAGMPKAPIPPGLGADELGMNTTNGFDDASAADVNITGGF